MSKFITQNPAKSRRKEASRARKAAVWNGMSRRDRRKEQTAGMRDMLRKAVVLMDKLNNKPPITEHERAVMRTNVSNTPHSSYLDAIGVEELTPRQIAARKAAATRAANKAAKGV